MSESLLFALTMQMQSYYFNITNSMLLQLIKWEALLGPGHLHPHISLNRDTNKCLL